MSSQSRELPTRDLHLLPRHHFRVVCSRPQSFLRSSLLVSLSPSLLLSLESLGAQFSELKSEPPELFEDPLLLELPGLFQDPLALELPELFEESLPLELPELFEESLSLELPELFEESLSVELPELLEDPPVL